MLHAYGEHRGWNCFKGAIITIDGLLIPFVILVDLEIVQGRDFKTSKYIPHSLPFVLNSSQPICNLTQVSRPVASSERHAMYLLLKTHTSSSHLHTGLVQERLDGSVDVPCHCVSLWRVY